MDVLIPAGVAVVAVFIAWKILKGLIKVAAIVAVVALAGYLYWQGLI